VSTNRLASETSPYLLQHAHNPVDWYAWGAEAHERARREDKPILLSIGYAACHWCHVMERESFENDEIASLMNRLFVPIKVDREERPDVDEIYMNAVQLMTGSGGWPLTVFLTPDLKPFFGGTYFPPEDRWGRVGFKTVLTQVGGIYRDERANVERSAEQLTEHLRGMSRLAPSRELLTAELFRGAVRDLGQRFDAREGGFTRAPKFPPSGAIALLLRHHHATGDPDALHMAELTLQKMGAGGLYDQLGGGFHRYATDDTWLVPHFEKMLYDNALLAGVYLEAHQVTGKPAYARVARETLEYVLREMQGPEGGYFSSQDADSEGVEGKFFVWSREEIQTLLGDDAELFASAYDVSPQGNWEGTNVLRRVRSAEELAADGTFSATEVEAKLDACRRVLFSTRERRVRPGLDDKVLTSWNGLMIIAMARAYRVLGDARFLESARRAADFLLGTMVEDGRLLATYRAGQAKLLGYLDDHAFLMGALIELFDSDCDLRWLGAATGLAGALDRLFWDDDGGALFFTGKDHEKLIVRSRSGYDGAMPSGNSMAAIYLLRLAALTGEQAHESRARAVLHAFQAQMGRAPGGFLQMLLAVDDYLAPRREIAVVGSESSPQTRDALRRLWRRYAPRTLIALMDPSWPSREERQRSVPLLEGKTWIGEGPTFYVCQNYTCSAPTESLEEVERALSRDGNRG
jgi:hypothetical protein